MPAADASGLLAELAYTKPTPAAKPAAAKPAGKAATGILAPSALELKARAAVCAAVPHTLSLPLLLHRKELW